MGWPKQYWSWGANAFSPLLPLREGPRAQGVPDLEDPAASGSKARVMAVFSYKCWQTCQIENRCKLTSRKCISRLLTLHRNPSGWERPPSGCDAHGFKEGLLLLPGPLWTGPLLHSVGLRIHSAGGHLPARLLSPTCPRTHSLGFHRCTTFYQALRPRLSHA